MKQRSCVLKLYFARVNLAMRLRMKPDVMDAWFVQD